MKLPWLTLNERFAIIGFAVFLCFCAFFGYMKVAQAAAPTEHPGEPCPGGTESCYDPIQHAIYYTREEDRAHELEHADGMRHTPWASMGGQWPWMCARITEAGDTHWRVGETVCRTPRGEYVNGGT